MELLPQIRISFASAKNSTRMPTLAPSVWTIASPPAMEQMVRSSSEAPNLWKKRRSIDSPWTKPMVPA